MELLVLGSGTIVPHATRGAPGYAVRLPKGVLLLDSGPGSHRKWPTMGIGHEEVRWIATTHHHVDHTSDLPAILFAYRVASVPRPRHLTLWGPPGHRAFVSALSGPWHDWMDARGYGRDVEELSTDGRPVAGDGFTISARAVAHSQPAVGYRIEAEGRVLAYGGDSGPCDALVDLCRGAHVALLESSMPDGRSVEGHSTPGIAGEIAAAAGVELLVLCHLYPDCDGVDVVAQAKCRFSGEVHVATEGTRLRV